MTPWLSVIGIGEDGLEGLSPAARTLVETAEVLVGGARHLGFVPVGRAERLTWASPISKTIDAIAARRGRRVSVLATGDPMCYGIGVVLARHFDRAEMTIIPAVGAFSLACARLGWPLAEVETLTLQGRPLELLNLYIAPEARLLILSRDGETPSRVAATLRERGFGPSRIAVLEHLGGPAERRIDGTAEDWNADRAADLNTVAVECRPGPDAKVHSRVPGLPDDAFTHDGQITKREVRAATLAALAPLPRQRLWDVGAGCGSIAIEWLRAAPGARAVAVEKEAARSALIAHNAAALGVPGLEIVTGPAPRALDGLEPPDAVFIGGGITAPGLIETCWTALKGGGRLVANVVTAEGEAELLRWRNDIGGALIRIAVSHVEPMGAFSGWRARAPVTQWAVEKP